MSSSSKKPEKVTESYEVSDDMPDVPFDDDPDAPLDTDRMLDELAKMVVEADKPVAESETKSDTSDFAPYGTEFVSHIRKTSIEAFKSVLSPFTSVSKPPTAGSSNSGIISKTNQSPLKSDIKMKGVEELSKPADTSVGDLSELIGGFELKDTTAVSLGDEEEEEVESAELSVASDDYTLLSLRDRVSALEKIVERQQKQIDTLNADMRKERESFNREIARLRSVGSSPTFSVAGPAPTAIGIPTPVSTLVQIASGAAVPAPQTKKKAQQLSLYDKAALSMRRS
jgi:uncharacterized coiled-coil protein SlyX